MIHLTNKMAERMMTDQLWLKWSLIKKLLFSDFVIVGTNYCLTDFFKEIQIHKIGGINHDQFFEGFDRCPYRQFEIKPLLFSWSSNCDCFYVSPQVVHWVDTCSSFNLVSILRSGGDALERGSHSILLQNQNTWYGICSSTALPIQINIDLLPPAIH